MNIAFMEAGCLSNVFPVKYFGGCLNKREPCLIPLAFFSVNVMFKIHIMVTKIKPQLIIIHAFWIREF